MDCCQFTWQFFQTDTVLGKFQWFKLELLDGVVEPTISSPELAAPKDFSSWTFSSLNQVTRMSTFKDVLHYFSYVAKERTPNLICLGNVFYIFTLSSKY